MAYDGTAAPGTIARDSHREFAWDVLAEHTTPKSCIRMLLLQDRATGRRHVAVRGTDNWTNIGLDVWLSLTETSDFLPKSGEKVVAGLNKVVTKWAQQYGNIDTITGHSLGAFVASGIACLGAVRVAVSNVFGSGHYSADDGSTLYMAMEGDNATGDPLVYFSTWGGGQARKHSMRSRDGHKFTSCHSLDKIHANLRGVNDWQQLCGDPTARPNADCRTAPHANPHEEVTIREGRPGERHVVDTRSGKVLYTIRGNGRRLRERTERVWRDLLNGGRAFAPPGAQAKFLIEYRWRVVGNAKFVVTDPVTGCQVHVATTEAAALRWAHDNDKGAVPGTSQYATVWHSNLWGKLGCKVVHLPTGATVPNVVADMAYTTGVRQQDLLHAADVVIEGRTGQRFSERDVPQPNDAEHRLNEWMVAAEMMGRRMADAAARGPQKSAARPVRSRRSSWVKTAWSAAAVLVASLLNWHALAAAASPALAAAATCAHVLVMLYVCFGHTSVARAMRRVAKAGNYTPAFRPEAVVHKRQSLDKEPMTGDVVAVQDGPGSAERTGIYIGGHRFVTVDGTGTVVIQSALRFLGPSATHVTVAKHGFYFSNAHPELAALRVARAVLNVGRKVQRRAQFFNMCVCGHWCRDRSTANTNTTDSGNTNEIRGLVCVPPFWAPTQLHKELDLMIQAVMAARAAGEKPALLPEAQWPDTNPAAALHLAGEQYLRKQVDEHRAANALNPDNTTATPVEASRAGLRKQAVAARVAEATWQVSAKAKPTEAWQQMQGARRTLSQSKANLDAAMRAGLDMACMGALNRINQAAAMAPPCYNYAYNLVAADAGLDPALAGADGAGLQ